MASLQKFFKLHYYTPKILYVGFILSDDENQNFQSTKYGHVQELATVGQALSVADTYLTVEVGSALETVTGHHLLQRS